MEKEKKPVVDDEQEEAILKISLAQPGNEPVTVRAKSSTLVSKLMNAFAQSSGVNAKNFRLVTSEGDRMVGERTLGHYNIQDGDQLDVVIEQMGGAKTN